MGRKGDRKVRQDLARSTHGGQLQHLLDHAWSTRQSLHAMSHATSVTVARLLFGHSVCACEDSLRPQRKKACIDVRTYFPKCSRFAARVAASLSYSCCRMCKCTAWTHARYDTLPPSPAISHSSQADHPPSHLHAHSCATQGRIIEQRS
jgi:hypothetical protein